MKGKELWSVSRLLPLSFPLPAANFQSAPRSQPKLDYLNKSSASRSSLLPLHRDTACPLSPAVLSPTATHGSPVLCFPLQAKTFQLEKKAERCTLAPAHLPTPGFIGPQTKGGPGGAVLPPSYSHTEICHYLDCTRSRKLSWEMQDVLTETTSALLSDTIPTLKNCQCKHRDLLISSTQ